MERKRKRMALVHWEVRENGAREIDLRISPVEKEFLGVKKTGSENFRN